MCGMVIVSKDAYHQIKSSVINASGSYEVGGVLIGCKFLNFYFIKSVTVPLYTAEKSKVSFTLDGEAHTLAAQKIIERNKGKLFVLGIWHSHICDGDRFSEQDRKSNRELAASLGGAVSMLAVMSENNVRLTSYFINKSGREQRFRTFFMI